MNAIEKLGNLTYVREFDESRPLKHLIRLRAPHANRFDMLPTAQTRDIFAYGATLDEAVDLVLEALSFRTMVLRIVCSTI